MFIGEYRHNRDAKGRIIIPSKFREELLDTFVLARGLDECLTIYPADKWSQMITQVRRLARTKMQNRKYQHVLFSQASECSFDSMGRISIPENLALLVKLGKECTLIGMDDHIEIWSTPLWEKYFAEADSHFAEIADSLEEISDYE